MRRVTPCQLFALLAYLWAPLLAACSGGSNEGTGAAPTGAQAAPPAGQGSPSSSPEELRAAQDSAVEAMCERLVECAVESARASMSPEEVAELELEQTAPRLRDECEDEGGRSDMSPRQVRVVQGCVNNAAECDALQTCLDSAKKAE